METIKLGKYELHEQIGRGGFGTVYRATDTVLGRDVALKILHPTLTVDADFIERFRSEARKIAAFDHSNIVTVFELGEESGRVFIAMRYLPGGSLRETLQRLGPLTFEQSLQITKEISKGLKVAHAKGLIHRDIKPENILFTDDGQAVISDFGLAKAIQSSSSSSSSSAGPVGTPSYRAPELWNGKPPASPATDEYSLACMFVELLDGTRLFDGETPTEIITQHLVHGAILPEKWPAGVPDGINAVLEKALDKDPAKRYQDAASLIDALQGLLNNKPNPEPVVPLPIPSQTEKPDEPKDTPTPRSGQKFPILGILGTLGVLGIFLLLALFYFGVKPRLNNLPVPTQITPPSIAQTALPIPTQPLNLPLLPVETNTIVPTSLPLASFQVQVKANKAYAYEGPSLGYYVTNSNGFPAGTNLTVIAQDPTGKWFQVKANDGTGGWLYFAWLVLPSNMPGLTVVSVFPPTPASNKSDKNNSCPWWGC